MVPLKKKITVFTILISGLGMLILTVAAAVSIYALSEKMPHKQCLKFRKLQPKEPRGK